MSKTATSETAEDRITIRVQGYRPFIEQLAKKDGRKISDWAKRQLAKEIKRRLGYDPVEDPRPSKVA